jgi:hypothetical protein
MVTQPVSWPIVGVSRVALVLYEGEDTRMGGKKRCEVLGLDYESPDGLECDDGGRAYAHLQRAAFAYQLTQTAFGQHEFAAVLGNRDSRSAAEDYYYVVGPVTLLHNPGPGGECPR